MNLNRFEDKKIALLGFGIENISIAKFFLEHKINFSILDREDDKLGNSVGQKMIEDNKLNFIAGKDYLKNLSDFDIIIRSPGVPYLTPEIQKAKKAGREITSSTKLFFEFCPAKIIGVTGTKGKGTTASLILNILNEELLSSPKKSKFKKAYLVGNIGIAPFDIIDDIEKDDLIVFELSSFQLQDLEKSPHVAVVVNLDQDHLDYHKNLKEYQSAKESILKYQSKNDFAVINYDYPASKKMEKIGKGKKYFFSSKKEIKNGAYVNENNDVFVDFEEKIKICNITEIKLIGRHNLENIAAASIVGKLLSIPLEAISEAVKNFEGLPHRLEFVRNIDGVKFYNDSFSTNPVPTIAAIKSFKKPITVILGGSFKGADFSKLAEEIGDSSVKTVILIGEESTRIRKSLENQGLKINILNGGKEIDSVVNLALKQTPVSGVVLFSPACASFDMFKDYKDRGNKFKIAVKKL